jgi:hypothetical protein
MPRYYVIICDENDRQIPTFRASGRTKIRELLTDWSINLVRIKYVKLTVHPPDESTDETV